MERIKGYLLRSYTENPFMFVVEMISVAFTLIASMVLAANAKDPNMLLVYSLYTVGSTSGIYVYYRRGLVWSLFMVSTFTIINIWGIIEVLS